MTDRVLLNIKSGETADSINDFINGKINDDILASWVEPKPGFPSGGHFGPYLEFQGLKKGGPDLLLPIDEARLFWSNKFIHVLSLENGGCRYVEVEETLDQTCQSYNRETHEIFLYRDRDRFGLKTSPFEKAAIFQYFDASRMIAWRLAPVA